MNIAICDENGVIKNVIVLDRVPEPVDDDFFAECPAWCWIGDSIAKPKPDDWIDTTEGEPTEPTIEQRVSDLEDAVQTIMFSEQSV